MVNLRLPTDRFYFRIDLGSLVNHYSFLPLMVLYTPNNSDLAKVTKRVHRALKVAQLVLIFIRMLLVSAMFSPLRLVTNKFYTASQVIGRRNPTRMICLTNTMISMTRTMMMNNPMVMKVVQKNSMNEKTRIGWLCSSMYHLDRYFRREKNKIFFRERLDTPIPIEELTERKSICL